MDGEPTTPSEPEVSLKEASERLGIGEKAVRQRIKNGRLRAREHLGPYGREWRIPEAQLPPRPDVGEGQGVDTPAPTPGLPTLEMWQDFMSRHEAATMRLGYLQRADEDAKALTATAESLRQTAAEAEAARVRAEAEARTLRDALEEERRRRQEAEDALTAERSRSWWDRWRRNGAA